MPYITSQPEFLLFFFPSGLSGLLGCQMLYLDGLVGEKKKKRKRKREMRNMQSCSWMLKGNTEICVEKNNYTLLLNFLGLYTAITIFRSKKRLLNLIQDIWHTQGLAKDQTRRQMNWSLLESSCKRRGGGCNLKLKRALAENTSQLLC